MRQESKRKRGNWELKRFRPHFSAAYPMTYNVCEREKEVMTFIE